MAKPQIHTENNEIELVGDGMIFKADFTPDFNCTHCDADNLCVKYQAFGEWCLNVNGKDCVFKLKGIKDKIIVYRIIIEHEKDCKKFKSSKKMPVNIETQQVKLIFNNCKEVNKYWREISESRNIPKNKISFHMYGDCLLK